MWANAEKRAKRGNKFCFAFLTRLRPTQGSDPLTGDTRQLALLQVGGERPDSNLELDVPDDPEDRRLHPGPDPARADVRSAAGKQTPVEGHIGS